MVLYCWVCKQSQCSNQKLTLHRFPTDANERAVWFENLGLKQCPENTLKYARICSVHFEGEAFEVKPSGKIFLKKGARPLYFNQEYIFPTSREDDSSTDSTDTASENNLLEVDKSIDGPPLKSLSKVVQTESILSKDDLTPKNRIVVKKGFQINSLLTMPSHLLVGGVGEIIAYSWKSVKSSKNPQPVWIIDIPNQKDAFERTDVNALQYNSKTNHIYAGCGDNNIYIFDLETRKLQKTLSKHTDYIHCLTNTVNSLISGGEDGIVNIWDLRTSKVSNKIEPSACDSVSRPGIGKWIGAVSSNEDYVLCGGGPRLTLWHYRFLTNSTVFPIDDKGIHVAEILNEKILAGGRSKLFYQMTFVGDIVSEIPVSAVTIYSAIHHTEPFNVLSLSGSSSKIDICSNFMYKNQQLSLY